MKSMPCAERNKNLYSIQELIRKNHTPNQQRASGRCQAAAGGLRKLQLHRLC
jgi:hypothetical protein